MTNYCTALQYGTVLFTYCTFSLGQEVADALLAECDQLLRAGAARSELPQLGLLQQRGPARLAALRALRLGGELVRRQRPEECGRPVVQHARLDAPLRAQPRLHRRGDTQV